MSIVDVSITITTIWNGLVAVDKFVMRHIFQPFVNAGYDNWCRKGKGLLVFYTVMLGILFFSIPVVIDNHDFPVEIKNSLVILIATIVAVRFVLLWALQFGIWMFLGISLGYENNKMARFILFDILKTMLYLGIFFTVIFGTGDIFLVLSMTFFLLAVFFDCCEEPEYKVNMSCKEHIHT